MKRSTLLALVLLALACGSAFAAKTFTSPNKQLILQRTEHGFALRCGGHAVVDIAQVGISTTAHGHDLVFQKAKGLPSFRTTRTGFSQPSGSVIRPAFFFFIIWHCGPHTWPLTANRIYSSPPIT